MKVLYNIETGNIIDFFPDNPQMSTDDNHAIITLEYTGNQTETNISELQEQIFSSRSVIEKTIDNQCLDFIEAINTLAPDLDIIPNQSIAEVTLRAIQLGYASNQVVINNLLALENLVNKATMPLPTEKHIIEN